MAYDRNPDDPYGSNEEFRRAARLDNEMQPDPELAEGPASSGRIALFAVAVAVVLGIVFYGLNNTSMQQPGTSTATNQAAPRPNTQSGITTGAAPAQPQKPPSPAPAGPDVNRSDNPPANNPAPSK